ncbi:unnamed protein product, partial [Mesorhabditis spiculigera]
MFQEWAEFLPHCGKAPRVGQQFFEAWNVTKEIVSDTLAKLIVTHRDHHLVFLGHSIIRRWPIPWKIPLDTIMPDSKL